MLSVPSCVCLALASSVALHLDCLETANVSKVVGMSVTCVKTKMAVFVVDVISIILIFVVFDDRINSSAKKRLC